MDPASPNSSHLIWAPQLTISKLGVVKLGADIIEPMLGTDNYWKWSVVNELQQQYPEHTIWLVGDLIHASTSRGQYRAAWYHYTNLERYFRMNSYNLEILAKFLDKLPQHHFDMGDYAQDDDGDGISPRSHDCMAIGCAVGHGPAAGLHVKKTDMDWLEYSQRVFGLHPTEGTQQAWNWCFHQHWQSTDNTPAGAAKRIRHLIQHGLPIDACEQRRGTAPYIFAVLA